MAGMLIGDDECPTSDIVNVFLQPSMEVILMDEWSHFANTLQISPAVVKKLQRDLLHDKIQYADIGNELLMNWRSRKGNTATIGNLLNIIMKNFAWKEVEDFLRTKIQQNARNFDDLDTKSKLKVLTSKIKLLGRERYLNSIKSIMKEVDFFDALKTHVDQEFIQLALKREMIELDKVDLPELLPYYINRTLIWKRKVNPLVFREPVPDIFVFEGIQRHHLSILAKPNLTDVSGSQLDGPNVRFILLELDDDFQEIVNLAEVPVHRIMFKDDIYYWIFTSGSLRVIRPFLLDNESEEISEQELIEGHLSAFSSRPLAIVSSPGMGKSVLLGSIAHQVVGKFTARIVLFLEIRSFFQHLKDKLETINLSVIKDFLTSYVSESRFGGALIRKLLDDDGKQFELFLDGFDDIPMDQVKAAKKILACLLESKNIRAHISSRQHMRTELEDAIGVISFDIVPFQPAHQISFLCGFWKNQLQIQTMDRLATFASIVIEDIFSDYIGIPLQCFLLAQIHSKEAQRYSNLDTDCYQIANPSKSLFDLYNKFFQMKFEKVASVDRECIIKFHWMEALKLVFSNNEFALSTCQVLEEESSQRSFSLESVYAVGILQTGKMSASPTFVHKTLAEFLIGDMIVEYLRGNQLSSCEKNAPFILESILAICMDTQGEEIEGDCLNLIASYIDSSSIWKNDTNNKEKCRFSSALQPHLSIPPPSLTEWSSNLILYDWQTRNGKYATFGALLRELNNLQWTEVVNELEKNASRFTTTQTFVHSTVCFFLNANLARHKNEAMTSSPAVTHFKTYQQKKSMCKLFKEDIQRIFLLTEKCYKHLLEKLTPLMWDKQDCPLNYNHCLILLLSAATYGDVEIFQYCTNIVDKFGETQFSQMRFPKHKLEDSEFECTPLHIALMVGNYKLTEYLVSWYDNKLADMLLLFENTVKDSLSDTTDVINNKINIIYLLKSLNIQLEIESFRKNLNWPTIAPELFIRLSDLIGYSPQQADEECIINAFRYSIRNDFQMNLVVDWLTSKKQTDFFKFNNTCIVRRSMFQNYLQPETFVKIYKLCPLDLVPLVSAAVTCGRADEFVKLIVDISGNVNICGVKKLSILHHAAYFKKPTIIRYLLSVGADINAKDIEGQTPLDFARKDTDNFNFNAIQDCIDLLTEKSSSRSRCLVL